MDKIDPETARKINEYFQQQEAATKKPESKFWKDQKVMHSGDRVEKDGEIDVDFCPERPELIDSLAWVEVDPLDEERMADLTDFLAKNYTEPGEKFRLEYTPEMVNWFLMTPGGDSRFNIAIIHRGLNKIVGFIAGVMIDLVINRAEEKMLEIDFLCLNQKMRGKGFATKLITMMIRRCSEVLGHPRAIYTVGDPIHQPVASTQYYHRAIDIEKLVRLGFSPKRDERMRDLKKQYAIEYSKSPKLRPFTEKDLDRGFEQFTKYLKRYHLHQLFDRELFEHTFLNSPITTYAVVDEETDELEDLISFYTLNTVDRDSGESVRGLYLYYYSSIENDLLWMFTSLLAEVGSEFDVVNILNLMENQTLIENELFSAGTGKLRYYLYNWQTLEMQPRQIGKMFV